MSSYSLLFIYLISGANPYLQQSSLLGYACRTKKDLDSGTFKVSRLLAKLSSLINFRKKRSQNGQREQLPSRKHGSNDGSLSSPSAAPNTPDRQSIEYLEELQSRLCDRKQFASEQFSASNDSNQFTPPALHTPLNSAYSH